MSFIIRNFVRTTPLCAIFSGQVQQKRLLKHWLSPTLKEFERRRKKLPVAPPPKRSAFLEWNYSAELYAFTHRLGESIDSNLLQEAFIHEGYIKKQLADQEKLGIATEAPAINHNASLSKEGTQLMSQYIFGYLRHSLPRLPEEGILAVHDFLMSEETLAHISKLIGTKDLILTSDEPEPSESTFAQCLTALVGALARSSGADRASLFTRDFVLTQLAERDVADMWWPTDPWAALQGILEREGKAPPEARIAHEAGVGTLLQAYCVAVFTDKVMIGKGFGETIAVAQEMAAVDCLRHMFGTVDSMNPFPLQPKSGPTLSELQAAIKIPNPSVEKWSSKEVKVRVEN